MFENLNTLRLKSERVSKWWTNICANTVIFLPSFCVSLGLHPKTLVLVWLLMLTPVLQPQSSSCTWIIFHLTNPLRFFSLQTERDVSVRQRAVDLLYAMCDRSNAKQIVAEMLSYLETADYSIREEIVRHWNRPGPPLSSLCAVSFLVSLLSSTGA